MELTMDQVQAAALTFSERDRVQLADMLYGSIGEGPVANVAASPLTTGSQADLDRRWSDLASGNVVGIPEEDVHAELDALVDG